jgi:hypothetical protein
MADQLHIWGEPVSPVELPICQAISARIKVALRQIERGDVAGALEVLKQCDRVLPLPTPQNMRAAESVLKRSAK